MSINGLLLTLSADPVRAAEVRIRVADRAGVSLGAAHDRWLPLAIETSDVKTAHEFHEWLEALPGVEHVNVIYVGFDEPTPTETEP